MRMNLFTEPTPSASATSMGNPTSETVPLRKFMFDQSFEQAVNGKPMPERNTKPVLMKPEQIEQLKREAYDAGFAAGKIAGQNEQIERQTTAIARAEEQITRLVQGMDDWRVQVEGRMRNLALAIARKVLPSFTAQHGVEEIGGMLCHVVAEMRHEPRLVVRVHESEFDAINNKLGDITLQKAYSGKVVVLADPEIHSGDCRIEWADGGTERNSAKLWKDIEAVVSPQSASSQTTPPSQAQDAK